MKKSKTRTAENHELVHEKHASEQLKSHELKHEKIERFELWKGMYLAWKKTLELIQYYYDNWTN